MKVLKAF